MHLLIERRQVTSLAIALGLIGFACRANGEEPARQQLAERLAKYYAPPEEFAGKLGDYRSPLALADGERVDSAEGWAKQRAELLALWHERLGPWPALVERPEIKRHEKEERDGYSRERIEVQISNHGHFVEAYLLTPPGDGPFPAVFVPFYEPITSIGEGERGRGTHDYGLQLVKRGFVTLSIGTPGDLEKLAFDDSPRALESSKPRRQQPLTALAYAAANCHTALAQMPSVDPERIGIIGLSYGGKWSMFASCLHEKFACAVWSDPGIVFNEENSNVNYWEPWYLGYDLLTKRKEGVPSEKNPRTGLYRELVANGEDLVSLHALMAPRPVLVSGGTEDPPRNWVALNHLIEVNRVLGQENRVAMTARQGHIPTAEALELELDFLEYWLKPGERPVSAKAEEASPRELVTSAKRIVFLGDSITHAGDYVAAFDAWLVAQELEHPPTIIDVGLPSETVSGLSEEGHAGGQFPPPDLAERLARVLKETKPDLVFACYGINCGIYQPFDEDRFANYQKGIANLKEQVEAAGAKLVIITPPFYDDARAKGKFSYNEVLDRYSAWLVSQRDSGWNVVDLHSAMTSAVAERRKTSPDFTFQPDAVHPNAEGQWFMATQLLAWCGEDCAAAAKSPEEMLALYKLSPDVLKLVRERVYLRRDAYLSAAGHKRPGIGQGLPVPEAEERAAELTAKLRAAIDVTN